MATALLKAAIKGATWNKVYSTTEENNKNMQSLFRQIGFIEVGAIEGFNIDGEAELVYCFTSEC